MRRLDFLRIRCLQKQLTNQYFYGFFGDFICAIKTLAERFLLFRGPPRIFFFMQYFVSEVPHGRIEYETWIFHFLLPCPPTFKIRSSYLLNPVI